MEIEELVSSYLKYRALRLMKRRITQQRYYLKYFIRYLNKNNSHYLQVKSTDIQNYHHTLLHCTLHTRYSYIAAVRDLYEYLRNNYPDLYPLANPVAPGTIKDKSSLKRLPHVPAESTVKKIVTGSLSVRNQLIAELAYGSGLRRCELEALNIEDIDVHTKQIYVRGKGGKTRIVPITEGALQTLHLYLEHQPLLRGPLLLSNRGTRLKPVTITWICRVKLGVGCHLLRHACATHLLRNGCSTRLIQDLLGHEYLTTTQRYTHIIRDDVAAVVNRLHPRSASEIEKCSLKKRHV